MFASSVIVASPTKYTHTVIIFEYTDLHDKITLALTDTSYKNACSITVLLSFVDSLFLLKTSLYHLVLKKYIKIKVYI